MNKHQCYVIKIGDRYFWKRGKKDRCQTAWCIAGAKRYMQAKFKDFEGDLEFCKSKHGALKVKVILIGEIMQVLA